MEYYIDFVLADEQRRTLVDAGIDFREETYGTEAYHRHGLVFSEQQYRQALGMLGFIADTSQSFSHLRTPQGQPVPGDVREVPLLDLPTDEEPVIWADLGSQSDLVDRVLAGCREEIGTHVVLRSFRYGSTGHLHVKGVLVVNLFCIPQEARSSREAWTYTGISDFEDERLVPIGLPAGFQRIKGYRDQVLAVFNGDEDGGSLWVPFTPTNRNGGEKLLDYILHVTARLMHPELGETISFQEFADMAARQDYIRRAADRLQAEEAQITNDITGTEQEIEEARQELTRLLRELQLLRQREIDMRELPITERIARLTAKLGQEFDNLASSGDFERLSFSGDVFTARTRPIVIKHGEHTYDMGRYDIVFARDGLKVKSADRVDYQGRCHPHVHDGKVCLGNLNDAVAQMMAEMSYAVLLPVLVRFLEDGYNPADSYARIEKFRSRRREVNRGPSRQQRASAQSRRTASSSRRPRRAQTTA